MFRSVYIIRFLSGFLLIVFALSVTPKQYLHNAFAKHIDVSPKNNGEKPYQLTASGYSCNTDNLVAESNFISEIVTYQFPLFSSYSYYILNDISFSSVYKIYSHLRGPPVNI